MDVDYWKSFLSKLICYKKIKNRDILLNSYIGIVSIMTTFYIKTTPKNRDINQDALILIKSILACISMFRDFGLINDSQYFTLMNEHNRYREDQLTDIIITMYWTNV